MIKFDSEKKIWSGMTQPSILNPEANLGQIILNMLERTPNAIAQIDADTGVKVTCGELRKRIVRAAQNLTKMGYKKGDVIAFASKNHENVSSVLFGCFCIGAPANGLDPTFNKVDYAHLLGKTKPKLIFCELDNIDIVKSAAESVDLHPKYAVFGPAQDDILSVDDFLVETGTEHTYFPQYLGDSKYLIAYIPCSSGTTGLSKGICLSHAQLVEQNSSIMSFGGGSIIYFTSLYWVSGILCMLRPIFDGFTRLHTTHKFSPEVFIDIVQKYKPLFALLPGRSIAELVHDPKIDEADFSSLRFLFTGGSFLTAHLRNSIEKRMPNGKVGYGYGLSEFGGGVTSDFFARKPNSSGFLMPNIKARILDDNGNPLGVDEKGEICLQHSFPFLGYYDDKEATDNTKTPDGWILTGDIGYFDQQGFIYVIDRKKEIFKYKGYQIFPNEIEEVIEHHPGVSAVCVTCIPDLELVTDLPVAVVIRKANSNVTEEELVEFTNSRVTSDYKQLQAGVFIVNELPMTVSGKIQRKKVQEFAILEHEKRKSSKSKM